jgi:hypothetical protein
MEERGAILHAVREALRPDGTPTEWAMVRAAAAGNRRPSLFGEGIREDAPRSLERLVATHMRHENCRGPG